MRPIQIIFALLLLLCSCQQKQEPFDFFYSAESTGNYKIMLNLSKDKSFRIEEQRIFFDSFEMKKEPIITKGVLSEEDFEKLAKAISNARLEKMEDSYGFEEEYADDNSIVLYQIDYASGEKHKAISIKSNPNQEFDKGFLDMISAISNFIKNRKDKN